MTDDSGERPPDELHGTHFAIVPEWLLVESSDLVKLYAILDRYAGRDGKLWPGQATLAERMACSDRHVRKLLSRMKEIGCLVVERRRFNGTTIYRLVKDRPEQPVLTDRNGDSTLTGTGVPPKESQSPKAKEPEPDSPRGFDQFWTVFPRKEVKADARRAWAKAVKLAAPEDIIDGAIRYRDDPNRDPSYTAHASSWLNKGRWEDEPLPPRSGKTATSHLTPSDRATDDDPDYWSDK